VLPRGAGWGSHYLRSGFSSLGRAGATLGRAAVSPYAIGAAGLAGIGLSASDMFRGKYRVGFSDYFGGSSLPPNATEQQRRQYEAEQREHYANIADEDSFTYMMAQPLGYFTGAARTSRATGRQVQRMIERRQAAFAPRAGAFAGRLRGASMIGQQAAIGLTGAEATIASTEAQLQQVRAAGSLSTGGLGPEQEAQAFQLNQQAKQQELQLIQQNADARKQALVEELQLGQQKLAQLQQERAAVVGESRSFVSMSAGQKQETLAMFEKVKRGEKLSAGEASAAMMFEKTREAGGTAFAELAAKAGGGELTGADRIGEINKNIAAQKTIVAKAEADIKVDLADGIESKFEQINKETEAAVKSIMEQIVNSINQRNDLLEQNAAAALATEGGADRKNATASSPWNWNG